MLDWQSDALTFQVPDGGRAAVRREQAREIADALWDLGLEPGAATAAARITDALRHRSRSGPPLEFGKREIGPLLRVASGLTWRRIKPSLDDA